MAITLSGANVHDKHNVKETLNSILIFSGRSKKKPKHLCLDKGYDFKDTEKLIRRRNIRPHIRRRGEKPLIGKYKGKPRRWVVERTNSWHNRFRAILIRWEENLKIIWLLFTSRALLLFSISLIDSFETGSKQRQRTCPKTLKKSTQSFHKFVIECRNIPADW
ncbi:transposase for insertion sequence element IS402 family protein [Leptospira borgpetersenii serovar Pomona str. 200901868]|uniref:Transposase for insertion sequence element IS402 family protein n=1 Tax=Leptospira borgpetersenii serovar Pomona str. 200901868 TaxID=1192866 RepID=M6VWQ1_LEPBO|nr:transposase for insertion sequence element IS402 family protein [Leptospira borgpetersenii serovar Pomona str. 200901868]